MKSGAWIGGVYAEIDKIQLYASGYPETQELFVTRSVDIDQDSGSFIHDEDDQPLLGAGGLLIRWEEIEFLEFIHSTEENADGEEVGKSSG